MTSPLISIIIATKNADKTLRRCLNSIIHQSNSKYELILIDGASTDNTKQIIFEYRHYISWWESKPDNGIYDAWNKGLAKSNGDWFCFIGADDYLFDNNVLKNSIYYLNKALQKNIKLVYGKAIIIDKNNSHVKTIGKPWYEIGWQIKHGMPIHLPHPCLFHHKSVLKNIGFFDTHLKIAGDYDLILKCLKIHTKKIMHMNDAINIYIENQGISRNLKKRTLQEVYQIRKKNKLPLSPVWTIVYLRCLIQELLHFKN